MRTQQKTIRYFVLAIILNRDYVRSL